MKTAGIIGGSGFIGSYVTRNFLNAGYKVKVSATDLSKVEKYEHLKQFPHAENLEIVQLDVLKTDELESFVKGCEILMHGGTPFQLDVQDPQKDLFEPTIKGTENFLEIVQKTPGVEKVILIASVAAFNTNFPLPPTGKDQFEPYDEMQERFTSTESHPYCQAKYIANQTVEKFINDNPDLPFEIITVSPTMVMGNSLSGRADSTSGGLQYLVKNNIAPNPFIQMLYDQDVAFAIVDVADVADAIFKAATSNGLHGKDYLLTSETYKVSDVHLMLNQQEPKETSRIVYKNDRAKSDLGAQFRPVKATLNSYGH